MKTLAKLAWWWVMGTMTDDKNSSVRQKKKE